MGELVPPTISVEAWAVRAYVDGFTHPSRKPIIFPVQDLGIGQENRVRWLVSVDVARDL